MTTSFSSAAAVNDVSDGAVVQVEYAYNGVGNQVLLTARHRMGIHWNYGANIQCGKFCALHTIVAWLLACSFGVGETPRTSGNAEKDGLELKIINVERKDLSATDVQRMPETASGIAAKWSVTTEVTNTAKESKFILTSPYYCATVRGLIEPSVLLPKSRLPIKSKENDFVELPPGGKLLAKHVAFAIRDTASGGFYLCGYFDSMASIKDKSRLGQFDVEWSLKPYPANNDFDLSLILLGVAPPTSKEVLGKDFKKLWNGRTMSKPVKIQVFETEKSDDKMP